MRGRHYHHHGRMHYWGPRPPRPMRPMMFGPRPWRPWGFFPLIPILFGVLFFVFIVPKLFGLLPFLVIGGALWYMLSPKARERAAAARERIQQEWADKPKRDYGYEDEKPKREDAEYV
ncbi:MAG: hypothetical protein KJ065_13105 [Anaerolineae bacterium]|nr:hypothetical protein [Anaerolineae bacterium]